MSFKLGTPILRDMRRLAALPWVALLLIGGTARAQAPLVRFVDFEGAVHPYSALKITQAIDDAEAAGDSLVLIRLDTPGGFVDSMEQIVKRMLAAEVPIVVWVGPSGAHAASAGFFILMAADVAAMAPGTRTGAASSLALGGDNREGDVALKKSNEDLAALVRSIAQRRGRDVDACEQAVFEARAYEESVAKEQGLIDLLAGSREELLGLLDGREVKRFDGSTVVLHTAEARFVESELSLRQQLMGALAHPIVALLLFLGGLLGIYVELTHPGVVLPGVVGVLCLVLFALSAQVLPVSAVGLLLILLAAAMFVLEVKVASYGMLTFGGVVCLLLGSWMLIEGPIPELRVPLAVVVPASLAVAAFCTLAVHLAARAQREPVGTGAEGLASEIGTAVSGLAPAGRVFVHGELWDATSANGPIAEGTRVKVVHVRGLRLVVAPLEDVPEHRS